VTIELTAERGVEKPPTVLANPSEVIRIGFAQRKRGSSLFAQRRAKREERIKEVMEERGLRQFNYGTPAYPRFLRNFER
jgi:hypothetical protein